MKKRKKNLTTNIKVSLTFILIFSIAAVVLNLWAKTPAVQSTIKVDFLEGFDSTYGIVENNKFEATGKSHIEKSDQVIEYACAYLMAYSNLDFNTVTGYEGQEYLTPECAMYQEEINEPSIAVTTAQYQEIVRTASDPKVRKLIDFVDQGFYYVEVYCNTTLVSANDQYNKSRWPEGIGSTIQQLMRLEFIPCEDGIYRISEIDIVKKWSEIRNEKYNKIFEQITLSQ